MWCGVFLIIFLFIFALYLFSLRCSFRHIGKDLLSTGGLFAHRGLFSSKEGIAENTMDAFRMAVEAGYGIELDVQLSSDGYVVVNHDYDLIRVQGIDAKIKSLTRSQLEIYGVPSFEDVLQFIAGRVPLIVEIKNETTDTILCRKTAELLDAYRGPFCVESFNPLMMYWFRKNRPTFIRGQLSTNFRRDHIKGNPILHFLLGNMMMNFLSAPDFIAFNLKYCHSFSLNLCKCLYHPYTFAWTAHGEEECRQAMKSFDGCIFEKDTVYERRES